MYLNILKSRVNFRIIPRFAIACRNYTESSKTTTTTVENIAPIPLRDTSYEPPIKQVKYEDISPPIVPSLRKESLPVDRSLSSFDDIPGPSLLRLISKTWQVIPLIGKHMSASTVQYLVGAGKLFGGQLSWLGGSWLFKKLLDIYGPIVRMHGPFGGDVVILSRPEHVQALFRSEGQYPVRASMDSIETYRLKHRRYKQAGPFVTFGPEWETVRQKIEKPLQITLSKYESKIDKTCDELIERIFLLRNKQEEVPKTFYKELYKWSLESLFAVTLNKRIGFLDPSGLSPTTDPGRILHAFFEATYSLRKIEYGPHFYKFFETINWKDLKKNCDTIDNILSKYLNRTYELLQESVKDRNVAMKELGVLESLLLQKDTNVSDILTILLDMILIGVNSTTHSVSYLMYNLAKAPRCQLKLYEEINKFDTITAEGLKKMPYLQACIKESLRLNPPMPVLSRVLNKDVVIHNYNIPRGTFVLIATHLSCLREEHFEDANKFRPERWLPPENSYISKDVMAFGSLPWGFGPKVCIAKDLAEMQLGYFISKVLKRFSIEYHYGDVKGTFDKFLSPAKRPVKFRFIDRV